MIALLPSVITLDAVELVPTASLPMKVLLEPVVFWLIATPYPARNPRLVLEWPVVLEKRALCPLAVLL